MRVPSKGGLWKLKGVGAGGDDVMSGWAVVGVAQSIRFAMTRGRRSKLGMSRSWVRMAAVPNAMSHSGVETKGVVEVSGAKENLGGSGREMSRVCCGRSSRLVQQCCRQAAGRRADDGTRCESQGATDGGRGMLQLLAGCNDVSEAWLERLGHGEEGWKSGDEADRRGLAVVGTTKR